MAISDQLSERRAGDYGFPETILRVGRQPRFCSVSFLALQHLLQIKADVPAEPVRWNFLLPALLVNPRNGDSELLRQFLGGE